MTDSLLSRLKEAAGPDRELDGLIALDNGWKQLAHDLWRKGDDVAEAPPRYTGDTDTARGLVPASYSLALYSFANDYKAEIVGDNPNSCGNHWSGIGSSLALALLIAIYSAREESQS